MSIHKSLQKLFGKCGLFISRTPLKFYYDLENEIKSNLILNSEGVLHIGAHYGQESEYYNEMQLDVIWIEAIPEAYNELRNKISKFAKQRAYCALVGNENLANVDFFISNNNGSASSIFKISKKADFKSVLMQTKLQLPMVRLDTLLSNVDMTKYDHWIIDVQGAELLVLEGAGYLISFCRSITIEVSTRETYINGARYQHLKDYLFTQGFFPLWEPAKYDHTDIPFIRFRTS